MDTEKSIPNMYYNQTMQSEQLTESYTTDNQIEESFHSNQQSVKQIKSSSHSKYVKYYDGLSIATQFIHYFYHTWMTNPLVLIDDDVIKPYSKLQFNNNVYEGPNFVEILTGLTFPDLQYVDCKWEILNSGSRQIYIMVVGSVKNDFPIQTNTIKNFSQSFMIAYTGENKKSSRRWTLMNSILIIF